jgi:CPA2 family monovalent cation:H+ antiporter-2
MLSLRYPPRTAASVGIVTAQIGEFSFLLAATGSSLGIFNSDATNVLVAAAIISITLTPLLYRLIDPVEDILRRIIGTPSGSLPGEAAKPSDSACDDQGRYRAVVVGYGRVGQTLVQLLRENKLDPAVIELNLQTVRQLNTQGIRAVYGDAASLQTLVSAGVAQAVVLILSSADARGITEIIRLARELNPQIRIIARTTYVDEVAKLRRAGTDAVFSSEAEVALALTEFVLVHLGATAEQLDRQRQRIRSELLGDGRQGTSPLTSDLRANDHGTTPRED